MSNSVGLREVKLIRTRVMSCSFIGRILLPRGRIESASLDLRSGVEIEFGIGAEFQVLNLTRRRPATFIPCPIFANTPWKLVSGSAKDLLLDCRIWTHGIGGERHKESGNCDAKVVRVRMVENGRASIAEACIERFGLLVFS